MLSSRLSVFSPTPHVVLLLYECIALAHAQSSGQGIPVIRQGLLRLQAVRGGGRRNFCGSAVRTGIPAAAQGPTGERQTMPTIQCC